MLEWVKYYNLAVAKTFLTQQTELGSTGTGARALGEVFYDQIGGIVQADCEAIANLLNNTLVVPLARWNCGEREFYTTFAPSQRARPIRRRERPAAADQREGDSSTPGR